MKISINTLQKIVDRYDCGPQLAPHGSENLALKIGSQLGAIDEVLPIGNKYHGIVIAKIVDCQPHPNADRLKVCLIDDGGKVQAVQRDDNGHVQVVCGAPNARPGITVAWLPPGSTVPDSVDKQPFVLSARDFRGVLSNGMLASPRELALGDNHEGILEIDGDVAPGRDFAAEYGLANDVIFDIENKMFTHRPDCFGYLGVAREIAGIQGQPFKSPEWYRLDADVPAVEGDALPFSVRNEVPDLVPRFTAIALRDVKVGSSPVWLQVELSKVGLRSINNIVDLTNWFMLETGQPSHAYDYDKVKALDGGDEVKLVVRRPQSGETIKLLNGKTITPREEAIMIASETKLIGLGGVMGGADTEVDEHTTRIIIEVANFDMYSVRRTSMAHGLFTDAVTRFNKGQSPLQTRAVLAKILSDVQRLAGGQVASQLVDDVQLPAEMVASGSVYAPVVVSARFINERLGLGLVPEEMLALLRNVEFKVAMADEPGEGTVLTVTAPFWRTDIEIREDVVEEIGRLYGYDKLPLELPRRSLSPAVRNPSFELKQRLRDSLAKAGANEVLTYSFVPGALLERACQDPNQAYKLSNAISPELQFYRLSLTPSLLDKVHTNIKAGYGQFALFEIGKAHIKGHVGVDGLPRAYERLALVFAADDKTAQRYEGAAYYQALRHLTQLMKSLGLESDFHINALANNESDMAAVYYEPGRAATITVEGQIVGRIGEYRPEVRRAFKLPAFCAGFELGVSILAPRVMPEVQYVPLSRYPRVEQDLCLRVPTEVSYYQLYSFVDHRLSELQPEHTILSLSPVDVYQRPDDPQHKQITLRLGIASYDKTMRDSEVSALLDTIAQAAAEALGAVKV